MIVFCNCKINIGLYITEKRDDGYHNLETIFFPLPLYDVLELVVADKTDITILGRPIPGNANNNIILEAYYLLKQDYPHIPPVHFYLLKNVPTGAGLGGGSANGANTLIALNKKFQLHLSFHQLLYYALQLGSDCPFFIQNQPCFATGRGELLETIPLHLSSYKIAIINPGIHVSTSQAFSLLQPKKAPIHLKDAINQPIEDWLHSITNDFENVVIKMYPQIGTIKQHLYEQGASFALMSGSGSTVYGIFKKEQTIQLNFPSHYYTTVLDL